MAATEGSAVLDVETAGSNGSESGVAKTEGSTGTSEPPGVGTGIGSGSPSRATPAAGKIARSLVLNRNRQPPKRQRSR